MSPQPDIDDSFSIKEYRRSLSHRDVFTGFSIALLFVAVMDAVEWAADDTAVLKVAIFFTFTVVNHVLYKLEHRRPNNFIGRNIQDYIFILLILIITKAKMWAQGYDITFGGNMIGGAVAMIIAIIILVVFLELLIAGLKRILKMAKWQIM